MRQDCKKILAVDDEEDILEILQFNLSAEGFDVETASSAEEALQKNLRQYDLFILDVMMGKMSGFHLAEKMRKELRIGKPIIFLTARGAENDKITGFNLGADDYMAKPFSIKELAARVRAVLRRYASTTPDKTEVAGNFTIDNDKKRIGAEGLTMELTKKEFEILSLLLMNPGKIFPRQELLDRIWGNDVIVTDRTVDVTIARIRKKMGEKGESLKNKSGYGYYFEG
jgi:two-component system, OmpR family, alkaline phosphatase synthesis response regulator PhoP